MKVGEENQLSKLQKTGLANRTEKFSRVKEGD